MSKKLKIGLVDNYLNNYHCDVLMKFLAGPLAKENVEIIAAWEWMPKGDKDWCKENNVKRCASVDEVTKAADYIMVMSPNNNEYHRMLAEKVIPAGKPIYIDKFLHPVYSEAVAIVEGCQKANIPLMSSSALAFAVELNAALKEMGKKKPEDMFCKGISSWSNYGVHSVSPVIRVMGGDIKRLINVGSEKDNVVVLDYKDGRKATIQVVTCENEWQFFPTWNIGIRAENKYYGGPVKEFDAFYINLFKEVFKFFRTGKPGMSIEQQLAVCKVLEDGARSLKQGGVYINY